MMYSYLVRVRVHLFFVGWGELNNVASMSHVGVQIYLSNVCKLSGAGHSCFVVCLIIILTLLLLLYYIYRPMDRTAEFGEIM